MNKLAFAVIAGNLLVNVAHHAPALAQDYVVRTERTFSGWETTVRERGPASGGVHARQGSAPANDCDKAGIGGFQLVNPEPGERVCFGRR